MKCPHCGEEIESIHSQGGQARAASLTKARRSAIAKAGAAARWKDHQMSPAGITRKQRREKQRQK